jgi:hypothetical protein
VGQVMDHAVVILGALGFALCVVTWSGLSGENLVVLTAGCVLLGMSVRPDAPWPFTAVTFFVVAVLATTVRMGAELYSRRRERSS